MFKSLEEDASIFSLHSKTSTNHGTTGETKSLETQSTSNNDSHQKFISIISDLLSNICEEGKPNFDKHNTLLKVFASKEIPPYSIKEYLERLIKYTNVNESTIIMILIYIDRFCHLNNLNLNYYIIHKLILAAFVIAIKFNEDSYNSVSFYAKLGGVSKNDMSHLEFFFIHFIKYDLFVDSELFDKYKEDLLSIDGNDDEDEDKDEEEEENEELYKENKEEEFIKGNDKNKY